MGLETNITDIQSLNQNWPPVSDPRAQGADHLRNLKKAIQLTFPSLRKCLLNDAQFSALASLVGDGSGSLNVPSVTDWGSKQPIPASDAEGRYVHSANDGVNSRINAIGVSNQTGLPWVKTGNTFISLQQAGDYATNGALSAEAKVRNDGDNYLNSIKANLGGGNKLKGQQTITDGNQFATTGNYSEVSGGVYDTSLIKGTAPNGTIYQIAMREYAGSHYSMLHYIYDGTNFHIYEMPQTPYNGGRLICPAGTGAVLSDLANYLLVSDFNRQLSNYLTLQAYQSDFATSDSRVINLPYGHRIQTFSVTVRDNTRITFPVAFSGAPTHVGIEVNEYVDCDHAYVGQDSTGFTVRMYRSGEVALTILAIGPK